MLVPVSCFARGALFRGGLFGEREFFACRSFWNFTAGGGIDCRGVRDECSGVTRERAVRVGRYAGDCRGERHGIEYFQYMRDTRYFGDDLSLAGESPVDPVRYAGDVIGDGSIRCYFP